MDFVTLGSTGIRANQIAFGALPIQRVTKEEAVRLLRMALDAGITYFDTARWYTDSEEKLGLAFEHLRDRLFIATKSGAKTGEELRRDLKTSLSLLRTDYIDVYQFHTMKRCWRPRPTARCVTSASPTIACTLRPRLLNPVCTKHSSSPSAIFPATRK